MIGLLAAVAAAAHGMVKTYDLTGTAGICVRWDRPARHVDAVVVTSAGNPVLDAMLLDKARAARPPAFGPMNGHWVGLNVGVNADGPPRPEPDCSKIRITKPHQ